MASIELKNIVVEYPALTARKQSARVNLLHLGSGGLLASDVKEKVVVKALNDVSFSASDGDRVALVGRNGAGKTTLLKLLGGVYEPTQGEISVRGRTSSLLGMGLTVDPELTGVEAVKYTCLLRGMKKDKIGAVQADVAEFTELGSFLNMPIRTYSAGMHMRLAFAIATASKPDILLMDEGMGAGDQFFLDKVKRRSEQFMKNANILFMASHSQMLLKDVCNKALLFEQGSILAAGSLNDVFTLYNDLNKSPSKYPVTDLNTSGEFPPKPLSGGFYKKRDNQGQHVTSNLNNAFDGCPKTFWRSSLDQTAVNKERQPTRKSGRKNHWIGLQYSVPKHPKTAFVRQKAENFDPLNISAKIAIDVSEDGFKNDIRIAAEAEMPRDGSEVPIVLNDVGMGRFWRVRSIEKPASGLWDIISINFSNDQIPDPSVGGAISSGCAAPGVEAFNAFDRNVVHPWVSNFSAAQVVGQAWIGWDFGRLKRKKVLEVEIEQWDEGENPNTVDKVSVQSSNDGFESEINTVAELSLVQNEHKQTFSIHSDTSSRFWRILAASQTAGGHWGVAHLNFRTN